MKTVQAYQCDRCGRLHPADIPPDDWMEVHIEVVNGEMEDYFFCSQQCLSMYFRVRREPAKKPVKRTRKKTT